MKYLKPYIIIAIVSLCLASSQHSFAGAPVRGIDVVVCGPKAGDCGHSQRKMATPSADGGFVVELSAAGSWTIKYASGPKKGQVIKTVTVAKAGLVKLASAEGTSPGAGTSR